MNNSHSRKTILFALLAIALSWAGLGCGQSGSTTKAGPPPTGAVELKLKFPEGRRIVQNLEMRQSGEMSVPGTTAPMKQEMTMGEKLAQTVLKALPDGGHELEMEYLDTRMSMVMGTNAILSFDSSKPSSSTNPMTAALQFLKGAKIRLFLDSSNEIVKVEGVEELQEKLTSNGQRDPSGTLRSMMSEDSFRDSMGESRNLPKQPVSPGDSWPVHQEIQMGALGTMVADFTYTLKAWERRNNHNAARIEFEGTIKTKPGQNLTATGMNMAIESGNSSGEAWFDLEDGMFVESTRNQTITMAMTMPPRAGQSATMRSTQNQVITLKSELAK